MKGERRSLKSGPETRDPEICDPGPWDSETRNPETCDPGTWNPGTLRLGPWDSGTGTLGL